MFDKLSAVEKRFEEINGLLSTPEVVSDNELFKKLMKKSVVFLMLVLCVILLAYPITEIAIFSYDIQHENFAVYYGDFDYKQVSGNRKDVFEISDQSDLYVRSVSDLNISSGSYSGYLLYGKNSRWVIAYSKNNFE